MIPETQIWLLFVVLCGYAGWQWQLEHVRAIHHQLGYLSQRPWIGCSHFQLYELNDMCKVTLALWLECNIDWSKRYWFRYWNVRTNRGTNPVVIFQMSFSAPSCPAGYYLYGNVACLPCAAGTYGTGGWTGSNCTACSAGTYATGSGGSLYPPPRPRPCPVFLKVLIVIIGVGATVPLVLDTSIWVTVKVSDSLAISNRLNSVDLGFFCK